MNLVASHLEGMALENAAAFMAVLTTHANSPAETQENVEKFAQKLVPLTHFWNLESFHLHGKESNF